MYKLRNYQQDAVNKTIDHFKATKEPAVIVLPTGAGKSLVIAELARIALGRVLVLAHVKELVEQNAEKFKQTGLEAGIYSAGLNQKDVHQKVLFGSIQSVNNANDDFYNTPFSLVVIDECHRVSIEGETQYLNVIEQIKKSNVDVCILGLTATPYRLGLGYIFEYHNQKKLILSKEKRFFKKCLFELPLSFMLKNHFLTKPIIIDSPVASYDFSKLELNGKIFKQSEIENILKDQKRITPSIVKNIVDMSIDRKGVMIFTSSVLHAREILSYLPMGSAIVTGETSLSERDEIIQEFKKFNIKYLVNVSVLTTGFDAPHVDMIALLRPTESISLFQQIIGRGLRLCPGKVDCLVLDYTGQNHQLFSPEIHENKPSTNSQIVDVVCPKCETINHFWGIIEEEEIVEHFGRQCIAAQLDHETQELIPCGFRFRFKRCEQCSEENDIAARFCGHCKHVLVDPDKKLKEAMSLKDAHVMKPDWFEFLSIYDKKSNKEKLEVRYYDHDGEFLFERFHLDSDETQSIFYYNFIRLHQRLPGVFYKFKNVDDVLSKKHLFRIPKFIIARKKHKFWEIREKIFDV